MRLQNVTNVNLLFAHVDFEVCARARVCVVVVMLVKSAQQAVMDLRLSESGQSTISLVMPD